MYLEINLLNNSVVHPFYLSGHDVTCTADGLEFLVRVTEAEVLSVGNSGFTSCSERFLSDPF